IMTAFSWSIHCIRASSGAALSASRTGLTTSSVTKRRNRGRDVLHSTAALIPVIALLTPLVGGGDEYRIRQAPQARQTGESVIPRKTPSLRQKPRLTPR